MMDRQSANTIIECRIHGIEYDFMENLCPKCEEEHASAKRVIRVLTCGLCGEIKASTQIMCGGPIGQLCQDCRDLIHKWEDAKQRRRELIEEGRRSAQSTKVE